MAEFWPAPLQQCLNQSGWQYNAEDTNVRTNVETGPKKVRRRYTRPDHLMQGIIWVHRDLYTLLDDLYTLTLQNGTLAFNFAHPITGVNSIWRFEETIKYSPLGGEQFQAKMIWREEPIA